jgi:hypothetical protein
MGLNVFNTGVQAGPAKAEWNAEVNAKGGVTLGTEFNTAEEAIAFLKKSAAFSDLKKYATSVELHGGIAAQVEGGLGLGDKKKALLGAYGSAGVELQTKVAINFKNPPELVVGYQVEGTANAGVGAFEFGDAEKKGGKLKGLLTDVQAPLWKFQGTLDQAAEKLGENAVKTAEVLRPTALPIRY